MEAIKSADIHHAPDLMRYDIIVIGASMGGFHALKKLISELPEDLAAAVFVVLHIPADHESFLAASWSHDAKLAVVSAADGLRIKRAHVYVAVPDFHLRLKGIHIALDHGPKHNFHRPAVDTLFSSAAETFGPRVIGVVLSGALDDGTAGLMDIKRRGGMSVIQTPSDAANPSMPASALACVPVDHCVPLSEMGRLLSQLAGNAVDPELIRQGTRMRRPSEPKLSTHICPECNGPLWFVETGKLIHFHCRIGHAFSGQSLLVEKSMALESALWSAVNALKDKANIAERLAKRARSNSKAIRDADYFLDQANTSKSHAEVITRIILKEKSPTSIAVKKESHGKSRRNARGRKAA